MFPPPPPSPTPASVKVPFWGEKYRKKKLLLIFVFFLDFERFWGPKSSPTLYTCIFGGKYYWYFHW